MSFVEEETLVAPCIGPGCCKKVLTVIVISTNIEIIENLFKTLADTHSKGKYAWKLTILTSFELDDVIRQIDLTGNIAIDFIILALDTSRLFCLNWVRKTMAQVHPDLRGRRVVLVNGSGLAPNTMSVSPEELLSLTTELNIDMLTANIFDIEEAAHLARRLLKYLEVSIGYNTGIPNLNV